MPVTARDVFSIYGLGSNICLSLLKLHVLSCVHLTAYALLGPVYTSDWSHQDFMLIRDSCCHSSLKANMLEDGLEGRQGVGLKGKGRQRERMGCTRLKLYAFRSS